MINAYLKKLEKGCIATEKVYLMKIFNYTEDCTTRSLEYPAYFAHLYPDEKLLFFDIETTGFAAKHTTLYLIGVLWYEDGKIQIRQWFNEDGRCEGEILTAFEDFCKNFKYLVHYNGLGFDLPYLSQKSSMLNQSFHVNQTLKQLDIYKEIRSYRNILGMESMKQVAVEDYLGIERKDQYSGGELIQIYQRYVARPNPTWENLLLQHNHDDLIGMPQISKILNYKAFFENSEIISLETKTDADHLHVIFTVPDYADLPSRISFCKHDIYLHAYGQNAILELPIYTGILKHYFTDYKNYYYLPEEDMAIHKSVATYVESQRRERAKKSTCYVKKEGCFIPCSDADYTEVFRFDETASACYQTLESFIDSDIHQQNHYIKKILLKIL